MQAGGILILLQVLVMHKNKASSCGHREGMPSDKIYSKVREHGHWARGLAERRRNRAVDIVPPATDCGGTGPLPLVAVLQG